jgi:hypothetical protein
MALKKNALDPAERKKICTHELGFRYSGRIPCTGPKVCWMCGAREDDAMDELDGEFSIPTKYQ